MPEYDKVYRVDPSTGEYVDTGKRVERAPYVPQSGPKRAWFDVTDESLARAWARGERFGEHLGRFLGLVFVVFVAHTLWTAFGS